MGGVGSGGGVGVGQKGKSQALKALQGSRVRGTAVAPPAVDEFDAPNDLTTEERNVWLALAPGAFKARTLTKATAMAFSLLCRNVVLEQTLRADAQKVGGANHRGILQRVETGLAAFSLRPLGKPMEVEAPKAADPADEFFGGPTH